MNVPFVKVRKIRDQEDVKIVIKDISLREV
jgi:hypothetical protein